MIDGIELSIYPGYRIFRDGHIENRKGHILRPQLTDKGYHVVQIYIHGQRIARRPVHRLVVAAYLGLDLNDKSITVDHDDENKVNNAVYNLILLSHKDNKDKYWRNRRPNDTCTHKECRRCGEIKLKDEFNKRPDSFDGFKYICIKCEVEVRYIRNNSHLDNTHG